MNQDTLAWATDRDLARRIVEGDTDSIREAGYAMGAFLDSMMTKALESGYLAPEDAYRLYGKEVVDEFIDNKFSRHPATFYVKLASGEYDSILSYTRVAFNSFIKTFIVRKKRSPLHSSYTRKPEDYQEYLDELPEHDDDRAEQATENVRKFQDYLEAASWRSWRNPNLFPALLLCSRIDFVREQLNRNDVDIWPHRFDDTELHLAWTKEYETLHLPVEALLTILQAWLELRGRVLDSRNKKVCDRGTLCAILDLKRDNIDQWVKRARMLLLQKADIVL